MNGAVPGLQFELQELVFDAGRLAILPCRPTMRPVRVSAVYPRGRSLPLVEAIVREAARHSTFRLRARTFAEPRQAR